MNTPGFEPWTQWSEVECSTARPSTPRPDVYEEQPTVYSAPPTPVTATSAPPSEDTAPHRSRRVRHMPPKLNDYIIDI